VCKTDIGPRAALCHQASHTDSVFVVILIGFAGWADWRTQDSDIVVAMAKLMLAAVVAVAP
jgi:hypothetical protein